VILIPRYGLMGAAWASVCAAVVGRHVPALSFLAIALGDEVYLNAQVNFYQRALAKATKEAYRIAKRSATETSVPEAFDTLLVPALGLMATDQASQTINQNTAERLVQDISDIAERIASTAALPAPRMHRRIVGVPAESSTDSLLIRMLQLTLAQRSEAMMTVPRANRATMLAQTRDGRPELICIAALPPSGNANARFLCRRLRNELPDANIVVLLPEDPERRSQEAAARLREAGANAVAYDLREAAALLSPK